MTALFEDDPQVIDKFKALHEADRIGVQYLLDFFTGLNKTGQGKNT